MKTIKAALATLCLSTLTASSFAMSESGTSSVTITLVNNSKETLTYTGVTNTMMTNTFNLSNTIIAPGATAVITGTTNHPNDLLGNLHFSDEAGLDNVFMVVDYRKIKVGQPVFSISQSDKKLKSTLVSKTFNSAGGGYDLAYIAATVDISDRS